MNKERKLKIALPILIIIMAFVWGPVIMGAGSKKKTDGHNEHIGIISGGHGGGTDLSLLDGSGARKRARTSYASWDRNPFMLGQSQDSINVEGIIWEQGKPKAMINGNFVGIGDYIGDSMIVDITRNSVTIKDDRGEMEIKLGM